MKRSGFLRKLPERQPLPAPSPVRQVATTVFAVVRQPKEPRAVNRHLLDMAEGMPCLLQSPLCNHNCETTVACHGAGVGNGKGMGYKVGDHLTVWGCSDCNHYTDAYGGASNAEKEAVFAAGHRWQVAAWQGIAAGPDSRDQRAAQWALDQLWITPIKKS